MAYAILRIGKIKSHSSATSKTQHNYRTQHTPNADPEQFSRNQELLNHTQRNYWDLAQQRIQEAGITRVRRDAVCAVEVLLTGSPETFTRDAQGKAQDMRGSAWVEDNLHFLQQRYGARNVVSFTLHQDELTPHIHAVVVPITQQQRLHEGERVGAVERLSCRDVFGPVELRKLQTDYAKAMAPYGLQRGVMYSTAIHEDVRRYYGAQKTSQEELAELTKPLVHAPFQLPAIKPLERVSPQAYLEREQARLNEHLAQQVAAVNAKLAQVSLIATANTLAQYRARVLEKQLATSKEREQQTAAALAQKTQELTTKTEELASVRQKFHHLLVLTAQQEPLSKSAQDWAATQQQQSQARATRVVETFLQGPVANSDQLLETLQATGYKVYQLRGQDELLVREQSTQVRFPLLDLRPNGQDLWAQLQQAIERTQQQEAARQQREEQQRREKLAQNSAALHAVIQARDAAEADSIEEALEKAGANVWQQEVWVLLNK
ncbi:MobV family relaxase [Hymenobacter defluvii]|uniref:Plasmid recombination protein n=1 Tax=Hymenobacter defluvii TaxID=2054411 RepID=A0ABS3TI70_9BACT|nr:MobV family relaxase [Hymenobacter defluvii]MBO3273356.1 plasmid recombination protein [Hymenobacter defluvii]